MSDLEIPSGPVPGVKKPRVMEEGDSVRVWREEDEHPLRSFMTRIVAAARTVGFRLESEQAYWSAVEADGSEGGKRETCWIFAGEQTARFEPIAAAEEITLREFEERFCNLEWVKANPRHPIAHMRWFYEVLVKTLDEVKDLGTCEMVRRNLPESKLFCLIPPHASPEEREEAIAQMNSLI